jgi:hypothetical protein
MDPRNILQEYYKKQAQLGRQAVTKGTNKFAKDYMLPAAKMAGSFTPMGPVIGLMDAKDMYDKGSTGWAMFGAGIEALPYAGKYIGKGIKAALPVAKDISKASGVREATARLVGIPVKANLPRLSNEELKIFRQVQEIGRLESTGKSTIDQLNYALSNNLPDFHFKKVFNKSKEEAKAILNSSKQDNIFEISNRSETGRMPIIDMSDVSRMTDNAISEGSPVISDNRFQELRQRLSRQFALHDRVSQSFINQANNFLDDIHYNNLVRDNSKGPAKKLFTNDF